ncbi:MAG: hypothetical protein H6713_07380 [Myxococcales bacterium]|nr:hypothetical protein [Myxococcales bacterium]MCB9749812.1 hypothetical protein [Myxococcales bacterium]
MGSFLGAWRVREYVYDADGTYRGQVLQRRELYLHIDARVRVLQDCTLDRALLDHPIAAFAGHHEFDLVASGATRRFLGPAVVGVGLQVLAGDVSATVGLGQWPELGFCFTSYGVVTERQRQLTGGRFSVGARPIADIVGVAEQVPRAEHGEPSEFPRLRGPVEPALVATEWEGERVRRDEDGGCAPLGRVRRIYTDERSWEESLAGGGVRVGTVRAPELDDVTRLMIRVDGPEGPPLLAAGSRVGWSLSAAGVRGPELVVEWIELLDAVRGRLVIVQRRLFRHVLKDVEVTSLRARG